MDEGWISLHRQLKGHWIWDKKPYSQGQAWVDILLSVNHKRNKIAFDNSFIVIEPGEMVTSLRKLGERWGWDKEAVRRFLDLLRSDAMLEFRSDSRKTVITVANWGFYQGGAKNMRQSRDSHETVPDTNNNVNNENNNKNSIFLSGDGESENVENAVEKPEWKKRYEESIRRLVEAGVYDKSVLSTQGGG